ncbi:hypothetical protein F6X40_27595 [Paraburkholderia sp. UCT31]|uniref:group I intron-associated PD-(D/E)XK endonuclease n=1 Tax=Paraburkholderia sp. UCT31 TaxID=2615209 RepID=UPI001655139F|nr:group I intron-associated PD-(D/E)XK endonuclease [Paraburkholderia sp. UCT31]MBC8740425.1 hypothetical protein [Paraburkholderia sp. UCT31]
MGITHQKGAIGVAKVVEDLTTRNVQAFFPFSGDHLPYDMVALHEGRFYKVQIKYRESQSGRSAIRVPAGTYCMPRSNGLRGRKYMEGDFDVAAIFAPELNAVLYVPADMIGINIALERRTRSPHFWWEDFRTFPPVAVSKRPSGDPSRPKPMPMPRLRRAPRPAKVPYAQPTKIQWPGKDELAGMLKRDTLRDIAKRLGVSDNSVRKRCLNYGIPLLGRGYWAKISVQTN